ncbi:protein of unknown function [Candidatus Filomicrobium marinum]|uniref:Uncharacterized protein n=1 Tax=Candidatus Filomicrobium marinum TaxID=1608628 RepID=A0A0D6JCS2_9HYPH|nr:protein of unknown function [Candidatus Filomicrobium marinum]CPR16463.1 protein of unknown function [Candidatus Filomicrobium marinum]
MLPKSSVCHLAGHQSHHRDVVPSICRVTGYLADVYSNVRSAFRVQRFVTAVSGPAFQLNMLEVVASLYLS